ncbi:MAG: hypothetical protein N2115_00570 [bacterium]|nr:hypothetical protein [bacterium]
MGKWGRIEQLSDIPAGMICVELKTLRPIENLRDVLYSFKNFRNIDQTKSLTWEIILEGYQSIIPNFVKFLAEKNIPVAEITEKRRYSEYFLQNRCKRC